MKLSERGGTLRELPVSSAITHCAGCLAALPALMAQLYGTLVPPPSSWEQLWGSCPASARLQHPSDPRVPGSRLPLCPPALRAAPGHDFSPLPPPGHRALPGAAREERGEEENRLLPGTEPLGGAGAAGTPPSARFTRRRAWTLSCRAPGCSRSYPSQVFNHFHAEPCQRCCLSPAPQLPALELFPSLRGEESRQAAGTCRAQLYPEPRVDPGQAVGKQGEERALSKAMLRVPPACCR